MYAAQGNASGAPEPIAPLSLAVAGSLFITRPLLNHYLLTREELAWRAAEVFGWAAAGELRWELERVFPLEQVIPTPSHLLDRISPIFAPFFPVFCAFSPPRRGGSNEPQAGAQGQETAGRRTRGENSPLRSTQMQGRITWLCSTV